MKNHETIKKLEQIYNKINSLIDEVYDVDKFEYNELNILEYSPLVSKDSVNERIAFNRYKKLNTLFELIPLWKDFSEHYADEPILAKISAEFINGKFDYNSDIKILIEQYPKRKQILYYFSKEQPINFKINFEEYNKFKELILASTIEIGKKRISDQAIIIKAINAIKGTKSYLNCFNLINNSEQDFNFNEKDNPILIVLKNVKLGNFKINNNESIISLEVPIQSTGIKKQFSDNKNAVFTFDLNDPQNFIISPGNIKDNITCSEHKIKILRKKHNFSTHENKQSLSLKY